MDDSYVKKLLLTSLVYCAFISVCFCRSVWGLVLIDFSIITNRSTDAVSELYMWIGVGGMVGSLTTGSLYTWLHPPVLLAALLLALGGVTIWLPWCAQDNLPLLMVMVTVQAFLYYGIIIGCNYLALRIWHKRSRSVLSAMHFLFTVAGVLLPLATAPFLYHHHHHHHPTSANTTTSLTLTEISRYTQDQNTTEHVTSNKTQEQHHGGMIISNKQMYEHKTDNLTTSDLLLTNTSSTPTDQHNQQQDTPHHVSLQDQPHVYTVFLAIGVYVLGVATAMLALLTVSFVIKRLEFHRRRRCKMKPLMSHTQQCATELPEEDGHEKQKQEPAAPAARRKASIVSTQSIIAIKLLFMISCMFLGSKEMVYIGLVYSYAYQSLQLSVNTSTRMLSVHFVSYSVGRFVSIFASSRVSPHRIIFVSLLVNLIFCMLLSASELVSDINKLYMLWITTCMSGLCTAPVFASLLIWADSLLTITPRFTSLSIMSNLVGVTIWPATVAYLMNNKSHSWFPHINTLLSLCLLLCCLLLWCVQRYFCTARRAHTTDNHRTIIESTTTLAYIIHIYKDDENAGEKRKEEVTAHGDHEQKKGEKIREGSAFKASP